MGEDSAIKLPSGQKFIDLYSIENCKSMCDHESKCKGMEWSRSKNKCILVKKSNADGPKYGDYFFCSKGRYIPMHLHLIIWHNLWYMELIHLFTFFYICKMLLMHQDWPLIHLILRQDPKCLVNMALGIIRIWLCTFKSIYRQLIIYYII